MKLLIDISLKKKLEPGDILMYEGGHFINIAKYDFLAKLVKENIELKKELENQNSQLEEFKNQVNAKLEQYHNILQTLVKEK